MPNRANKGEEWPEKKSDDDEHRIPCECRRKASVWTKKARTLSRSYVKREDGRRRRLNPTSIRAKRFKC